MNVIKFLQYYVNRMTKLAVVSQSTSHSTVSITISAFPSFDDIPFSTVPIFIQVPSIHTMQSMYNIIRKLFSLYDSNCPFIFNYLTKNNH